MQNEKSGYDFVKVHSVSKPGELALIKSILEAQEIPFFVKGENFGTLYGPANGLSLMDVMVREDYLEEAEELLKDFINPS